MPASVDPVREMLRAVLVGCASLHGDDSADRAVRVIVICQDGRKLIDMLIPKGLSGEHKALVVEAPAHLPGWSFTDRLAMFDGKPVAVGASRAKLLRVLAEAREPLTAKDLTATVFDDLTAVKTTRWHIDKLEEELQKVFPDFEGKIIEGGQDGYRLVLR